MHENEHAAALRLNAMHDLTALRRSGAHGEGWNAVRPSDIPIWHMRPGMQVQAPTHAEGWDTVISAPQHSPDWSTEHILVRNNTTHQERVLSRPYRSLVFVKAPAYMLSDAYFHATHDTTPTRVLQPAAPSRSRTVRAAATTGRTGR